MIPHTLAVAAVADLPLADFIRAYLADFISFIYIYIQKKIGGRPQLRQLRHERVRL